MTYNNTLLNTSFAFNFINNIVFNNLLFNDLHYTVITIEN